MTRVISLLVCLALLASLALVDAGKKKQRPYPITQKVIILQAGPSATYPWVGHCPPKGKCKHFYKVARPPFPSFLPPAPRLPYYAPAQYAPAQHAPAQYAPAQYAPAPYQAPVYAEPAPVYSGPSEPVYSAPSEPAYSGPSEPVYSEPAPVYSQPAEPVYSAPAPVYSEAAEESPRVPAHHHVDVPAPEFQPEPIIPTYSQSETVPDLSNSFAIQEVSPPEFNNYGSGSSDIGSSESQSYGDVAVEAAAVPTYAPEAPAVIAEVETADVQEPVYVPAEPTGYSGSSSSEVQQEIAQSTYVEQPALEAVQHDDGVHAAAPELTEFFNDPIYQEDVGEVFEEPAAPPASEPEVYQEAPVETFQQEREEAENYGERIRPRGGRR
ncbi:extensin-like [Daphnia pulex]|uniref:extensin-like n=1 Tax=Daphnia pulex TaxID=6669 RepID=UPI001EDCD5E7|nr:extensin-like [Daphnia pulex]